MEYMRIEGFLGGAISKLINKGIAEKVGYRPNVSIDSLNFRTVDKGEVNMRTREVISSEDRVLVDLSVSMTMDDFNKLIEEATK